MLGHPPQEISTSVAGARRESARRLRGRRFGLRCRRPLLRGDSAVRWALSARAPERLRPSSVHLTPTSSSCNRLRSQHSRRAGAVSIPILWSVNPMVTRERMLPGSGPSLTRRRPINPSLASTREVERTAVLTRTRAGTPRRRSCCRESEAIPRSSAADRLRYRARPQRTTALVVPTPGGQLLRRTRR